MLEVTRALLDGLFPEGIRTVSRPPGGSRWPTWRVQTPTQTFAVKVYDTPNPAEHQAALLRALRQDGFPVSDAHVRFAPGFAALVTAWMPGDLLAATLRREPGSADLLGARLGDLHARLHTWSVPDEIAAVLRRPEDAPAQGKALLHLDLHLLNVLIQHTQIGAVLDWEGARLGDARLDLARTLSILSVDPAILALPLEQRQVVRRVRRAYLETYLRATGLACDGLAPFLAWAERYLIRDLSEKVEDGALDPARRWTRAWASRLAGQRQI